jgi:hypothetical protein
LKFLLLTLKIYITYVFFFWPYFAKTKCSKSTSKTILLYSVIAAQDRWIPFILTGSGVKRYAKYRFGENIAFEKLKPRLVLCYI